MAEPQDHPLSAAQRSRIRRLSQFKEPSPGEEAGELNVVPYLDIITNIMIFVLASVSVSFIASIDTTPPSIGGKGVRSDVATKALNLSAWITAQGVSLKTSGGNIGPGCETVAETGYVGAKKGDSYDFAAITACAKKLKRAKPDFKDEVQVTITASPGIEYKTVIDVMDALRSSEGEELFPEVHFGVAR
jgi:biopolymer transport protein TolR